MANIKDIHRYLAGEATPEERNALETWLDKSPKNREEFESYRRIYDVEIPYRHSYDTKKALTRFRRVMDGEKPANMHPLYNQRDFSRKRPSRIWRKAAAVLLVAIGLSVYLYTTGEFVPQEPSAEETEMAGTMISTEPGEQKSFRLQDGSRVRLNAGSEIHIPEGYGREHREVELTGEAFFEIETVSGSSFKVVTGTAHIEVLGTSFGVRAWRERDESVVAVRTGKVSVRSSDPSIGEDILLEAGQVSSVIVSRPPSPAREVNIDQYIGWTRREFVFEDTPLRDVLKQLELHFNVTIAVDDSSAIDDPVTARYRDESLDEILEYTSMTHGVEFKVENHNNHN